MRELLSITMGLVIILTYLTAILSYLYGLYLAFSASIIFGVIVLILSPSATVIGLAAIFGRVDICEVISQWLNLPI